MTRYSPARAALRSSRNGRRTLAAVAVLAAVTMAHAPSVITIQPGDTLWDLARRHGTSVAQLQELNGLQGNATIYAGRTLRLPGGGSAPASGGGGGGGAGTHVVVRGDTLSEIAQRYGVSTTALRSANGMSDSTVQIGRKLVVPGSSSASLSSVPTHNAGVAVPESVRSSVVRHRQELAARDVPSKDEARQMVAATARQLGVDPALALAVAYHESGFQQQVVSGVDAIGVMQVLPSTGRGLSRSVGRELDLLDARDNIYAGVLLLRQLLRSTGSVDEALAGYYQGLGSVQARGRLPQTDAYLRNVNALRARFAGD